MNTWTSTVLDGVIRSMAASPGNFYLPPDHVEDLEGPLQPPPQASGSSSRTPQPQITVTLMANGHPEREICFDRDYAVIGSGPEADIRLTGCRVSAVHAVVFRCGSVFCLRDEGSAWGTFVNGGRVQVVVLQEGDCVGVGCGEG